MKLFPRSDLFRALTFGVSLVLAVVGLGCRNADRTRAALRVGASPVPHASILEHVKPTLERDGIALEIVEMNDYVQPNVALVERELDANFFQHQPYLDTFNRERGENLVTIAKVHVEPLGIYLKKGRALTDLQASSVVAIPNDPTNAARALELLERAGVIRLDPEKRPISVRSVVSTPKSPKLRELEGAQLPRVLSDVDAAVINTNYAMAAGLDPSRDAVVREDASSPYANVLVTRADRADDARLKALARELSSPSTRAFIEERFRGSLVPAF